MKREFAIVSQTSLAFSVKQVTISIGLCHRKKYIKRVFNMVCSVIVDLCNGINCQNSGECKAGVCECSSSQYTGVHCETGKILTIEKLFEADYFIVRW